MFNELRGVRCGFYSETWAAAIQEKRNLKVAKILFF